jgi:hypothetical protein
VVSAIGIAIASFAFLPAKFSAFRSVIAFGAVLIAGAVFGAHLLATGNATIALSVVSMVGVGLLTTVGSSS